MFRSLFRADLSLRADQRRWRLRDRDQGRGDRLPMPDVRRCL